MSETDPGPMITVALQLPATHYGALQEHAARGGISTSGLLRQVISLWLAARRNPRPPAAPEPVKRGGRGPAKPKVAPAQPAPLAPDLEAAISDLESSLPT